MAATSTFQENMIECSLLKKGEGNPFKPGDKRKSAPMWDKDRCTRCGLCFIYCPDGAVYRCDDGFFDVALEKCKGCKICHSECMFGALSMEVE